MFSRIAKQLTQELDSDGRLIPVSSLASADSYRPFCLVTKEQTRLPWQPRKYLTTPYKLADVFKEGTTLEAEVIYSDLLRYSETTKHKGNLGLQLEPIKMVFGSSGKSSLSISPASVRKASMVQKGQWKIDMSHKFIKEFSGSTRKQLFVVVEAFEINEPLLIEKMIQGKGKAQLTTGEICGIQGQGESIKKKMMMIPQGTVLAYVVQPLNTQEERVLYGCSGLPKSVPSFVYDGFKDKPESSQTAFQKAKGTIEEECEQLTYMSQDLRIKLLGTFESFMQDGDAISAVKSVLELSLTGGHPKHLMLELMDESLWPQVENLLHIVEVFCEGEGEAHSLWRPVHFLCSSLEDLDFSMLPLLVTCLEKNMVAKQLKLTNLVLTKGTRHADLGPETLNSSAEKMDGILEWILSSDKESIFSLPCSLTEEEKNVAAEMLLPVD